MLWARMLARARVHALRRLGGKRLVVVLVESAHLRQRGRRDGHGGELRARVRDVLLVDGEGLREEFVRVRLLLDGVGDHRALQVEAERDRRRERRERRHHVADEGEQLVAAHLDALARVDAQLDLADQLEAREDERHEREDLPRRRRRGRVAVRRVKDAAHAVGVLALEDLHHARHLLRRGHAQRGEGGA